MDTTCIPAEGDPYAARQAGGSAGKHEKRPSASWAAGGSTGEDDAHNNTAHDGDADDNKRGPNGVPRTYNCYAPRQCLCRAPERGEQPAPAPEADEKLLATYRDEMAPYFPFVIVSPGTTPAQLRESKPFLWSVIRMVASYRSARSMWAQGYGVMSHISEHVLMRSERSLDLLQGIIVVLGWYHYHCLMHAQLNNLAHLAMSLTADLGLNRHPAVTERVRLVKLTALPEAPIVPTSEERRALLGVWYLSSVIAGGFGRIESMRYTRYVHACLLELERGRECESDAALVAMVRLQHLTERIQHFTEREADNAAATSDDHDKKVGGGGTARDVGSVPGIPRAPAPVYISAFQAELDRLRASLTKSLRNNIVIVDHINTATLHLYEPPIADSALVRSLSESLARLDPGATPGATTALDVFYHSVAALRSWFETWLAIPVKSYVHLSMPMYIHVIYAITMLSRWSKLTSPAPSAATASKLAAAAGFGINIVRKGSSDAAGVRGSHQASPRTANEDVYMPAHSADLQPHSEDSDCLVATSLVATAILSSEPSQSSGSRTRASVASSSSSLSPHPHSPASGTTGPATSSTSPSAASNVPQQQQQPSTHALGLSPHVDPTLPSVIAQFKRQLLRQPGLQINMPEILAAMAARFEQATAELAAQRRATFGGDVGEDDDGVDLEETNNLWTLGARKLNITRAKLERWAEIVALGGGEGGVSASRKDDGAEDSQEDDNTMEITTQQHQPQQDFGLNSGNGNYQQHQQQKQQQQQQQENPNRQYQAGPPYHQMAALSMSSGGIGMALFPTLAPSYNTRDTNTSDMGVPNTAAAATAATGVQDPGNWNCDPLWAAVGTDLFEGWEPNLWFEGQMDWRPDVVGGAGIGGDGGGDRDASAQGSGTAGAGGAYVMGNGPGI